MIAVTDYPRLEGVAPIGHPYQCRTCGCQRFVEWVDLEHPVGTRVGVGYCDAHRPRAGTWCPIAIYGREGHGWLEWPMSFVHFLIWRERQGVICE